MMDTTRELFNGKWISSQEEPKWNTRGPYGEVNLDDYGIYKNTEAYGKYTEKKKKDRSIAELFPEECTAEYECLMELAEEYDTEECVIPFTLVPDPKNYWSHDPQVQWLQLLLSIFTKTDMKYTFYKFVFVAELTDDNNVHVHGYYVIKDRVKYHRWFLPACRAWGWIKPKKVADAFWTKVYCPKDIDKNTEVMYPVPAYVTEVSMLFVKRQYNPEFKIVKAYPKKASKSKSIMSFFKADQNYSLALKRYRLEI